MCAASSPLSAYRMGTPIRMSAIVLFNQQRIRDRQKRDQLAEAFRRADKVSISHKKVIRGWCIKFATGLNTKIGIVQIACIRVIKLSSCQNDPPMGESFWQNNSLITFILFELSLFWYLAQLQI